MTGVSSLTVYVLTSGKIVKDCGLTWKEESILQTAIHSKLLLNIFFYISIAKKLHYTIQNLHYKDDTLGSKDRDYPRAITYKKWYEIT